MTECACGCGQSVEIKPNHKYIGIPKYIRGHNARIDRPMDGSEARRKVSEANSGEKHYNYGKFGPESSRWNEDSDHYHYYHVKAGKLFRKEHCEICDMTLEENLNKYNRRFDMHNLLKPKNFLIMNPDAWICVCKPCHGILEVLSRGLNP